ncbi:NAD(P)-binding, partial [Fusarium albosuccineum]
MPVVAVAGGTGQLGRTIVDALLADGSYDVIILVRRANPTAQKEIGVPLISVDYANVDDLVSTLQSHNVNTVISTITTLGDNEPELNLIKAAEKSQITKRFVPSYWATDYS